MEFFPGLAWPLPRAFAAALASCRFEQGDVLYSDACAYDGAADATLRHHIQVLDPARSTRAITSEGEGKRFEVNWASPVHFEHYDHAAGRTELRTSTQGRLFTCLWKDELEWLQQAEDASAEPPLPLLLRELQSRLEEAVPALRKKLGRSRKAQLLFAMAYDLSSDASRVKAHAVHSLLESKYGVKSVDLQPIMARVSDAACFHPALVVRGIALETADDEAVGDALKGLLYAAGGGRREGRKGREGREEGDETGKADRFSLARHGLLVPMKPA